MHHRQSPLYVTEMKNKTCQRTIKKIETNETVDFERFCATTSAHGFSYLTKSSRSTRITWLIILILAFVFGIFHLYVLVSEYLKYNYHESIFMDSSETPVFPDITLCDNTGISDSSLER